MPPARLVQATGLNRRHDAESLGEERHLPHGRDHRAQVGEHRLAVPDVVLGRVDHADVNADLEWAGELGQCLLVRMGMAAEPDAPRSKGSRALSSRYMGSAAQDVLHRLRTMEFGERILTFGAEMLLSVLPIIILLSSLASHRVDDDIARHLGLNAHASEIMANLFRHPSFTFNVGVLVALLLSLAGTISVAGSVQIVYERTFSLEHIRGTRCILRRSAWAAVVGALLITDSAVGSALRTVPDSPFISGAIDFATLSIFFWWSAHFLLAGRERWRRLAPSAVATSLCLVGVGVFSSIYFSEAIVTDSRLYGTIGVVFSLVTWFIAIGAVICIGAVLGAVIYERTQHDS